MKRNRKYLIQSFEEEWTCPITSMPMVQPVLTLDGHSYEKTSILDWLKKKKTSPKTGLDLKQQSVIPNIVLRNVINKFENEFKYQFNKICSENCELNEKFEKIEERIKDINKQKTKTQNQYNEIKSKYSELLANSKKVGESYVNVKKEVETLKAENQQLKREKNSLKADAKSTESLQIENKLLKQETEKLKKENKLYMTENQTLNQQKKQSANAINSTKTQLIAAKKSNEQLKALMAKQINQYNIAIAKTTEHEKLKLIHQDILNKYNTTLEQVNNLTNLLQKNSSENKKSSFTDFTKDHEIQKMRLQCSRFKIQNTNLKTEIKSAVAELEKLKLQFERLKTIHSFCVIKAQQQSAQKASSKQHGLPVNKPEPIEEEKPQKIDILNSNKFKGLNDLKKKIEQPSDKKEYEPSKPWKAPDSSQKPKIFGVDKILKIFQRDPIPNQIPEIKPAPLSKSNSSPILQPFRDIIRKPFDQKIFKMTEQKPIKHILPFNDYLVTNPVLYDEQKHELDHTGFKINIDEFLKHNWSELKTLNLSECDLDDRGFELLTNEAIFFTNLNNLWLWNNFVVNVPKGALERFKSLRSVYFCIKGRHANPLNEQSKQHLNEFAKKNPLIQVAYDNKPL